MAVARMKKVTVFCHRSRREEVIASLERLGMLQLTDSHDRVAVDGEGPAPDPALQNAFQEQLDKAAYVIRYLQEHCPEQRGMLAGLLSFKEQVTADQFDQAMLDTSLHSVYQTCFGDEVRLNEIRAQRQQLESRIALLTPWATLLFGVETVHDTEYSRVVALSVPSSSLTDIKAQLSTTAHVSVVSDNGKIAWAIVIYLKSDAAQVEEALAGCRAVQFGDLKGRPRDLIAAANAELAELAQQETEIAQRAQEIASQRIHLMAVHDHLRNQLQRVQVQSLFAGTQTVDVICGWVNQRNIATLKNELWSHGEVEMLVADPDEDDNVPVELENHQLVQPFEVVTNLYGFPRYNEVDPTPLLAPFFFIFFGLALTDAGYGLLLMGLGALALRKMALPAGGQKLVRLLMFGGASAFVLGALTGSWFGDMPRFLPGFMSGIANVVSKITIVDPVSDPIKVLIIALTLGVIQVWTGVLINTVITIKSGRIWEGVLDGSWLMFIPGLILLGVGGPGLESISRAIVLIGGAGVIMAGAYRQKNWFLKPFSGLYNMYGIINYLGDVLSYSRLLALGLATAVIGVVVNQIAELISGVPWGIGAVLAVVMMIGGHIFNLLVNTLGSFVHSGRLQFVEFFTKFFEGGGKPFRPYRWEGTYVTVLPDPSAATAETVSAQTVSSETGGM